MSWIIGNQPITKDVKAKNVNEELARVEGYLSDDKADEWLVKFLKSNVGFTAQLLSGVDLFPFQEIAIKTMMKRDYTLCIWSRGLSKTHTAAAFCFLQAAFEPGTKIAILSRTFRQSREIFKRIEDMAYSSGGALLLECFNKKPSHLTDMWQMNLGSSEIVCLPLGASGEKLRGFRFNCVIIDELLLMPEKVLNEVILPFISVSSDVKKRQDQHDLETKLIEHGLMKEEERTKYPNSKLIGLSSASYQFEHLYTIYKDYIDKIEKGVEFDKNGTEMPIKGSYAVLQYPYDIAPSQFYNEALINKALSELSKGQFDREFGAKFTDDSSSFFSVKEMQACTAPSGEYPIVEIKGVQNDKYILSIDPSWAQNEGSDFFAMMVSKILPDNKYVIVHAYAVAGGKLIDHLNYFYYLVTHFNIELIVADHAGSVQFFDAVNESKMFKDKEISFGEIKDVNFSDENDYQGELAKARTKFNRESRTIVYFQTFSDNKWYRKANELLQSNINFRRIKFAGNAQDVQEAWDRMMTDDIKDENLKITGDKNLDNDDGFKEVDFTIDEGTSEKKKSFAHRVDLIERQDYLMQLTKKQCAMIEPKVSESGNMSFGLPEHLKRQKGANKARRDLYTTLLLNTSGVKWFNDLMAAPVQEQEDDWEPR